MKIEYIFIKKQNDFCKGKEQFLNLLASNMRVKIEDGKIVVDQKKVSYSLEYEGVENSKEDLFHLTIESSEEDKVIALETVDSLLRRMNENYKIFNINTIVDEVSIYYAIKLYPKIAEVENILRKLIYLFMFRNVGSKWMHKNVPQEMKDAVLKTLEKNNMGEVHEDYLYYADFIVLGYFFFAKYSLNSDYQRLIVELKKDENQSKVKIEELLEIYESKSNWERYFSDKIQVENLSEKWKELYGYRNQVAHSKRISKREYDRAYGLVEELKTAFENCIEHMDEVEMTEEQSVAVEKVALETIMPTESVAIQRNTSDNFISAARQWDRLLLSSDTGTEVNLMASPVTMPNYSISLVHKDDWFKENLLSAATCVSSPVLYAQGEKANSLRLSDEYLRSTAVFAYKPIDITMSDVTSGILKNESGKYSIDAELIMEPSRLTVKG